jgi:hypothetical protein
MHSFTLKNGTKDHVVFGHMPGQLTTLLKYNFDAKELMENVAWPRVSMRSISRMIKKMYPENMVPASLRTLTQTLVSRNYLKSKQITKNAML